MIQLLKSNFQGVYEFMVRLCIASQGKTFQYPGHINQVQCCMLNLYEQFMLSIDTSYTRSICDLTISISRNITLMVLQYNQQDAPVSQIIYSCKTFYIFRTVFTPIIRSSKLHIRQQAYVKQLLLPAASGDEMELWL